MDRFVCVRIVQANGMDLSLFQFDYDLTFAAFFLNADKTIYGRYGTRTSRDDAQRDMSIEGFRKAMEAALELHAAHPKNRDALSGKRGAEPARRRPEEWPGLEKFRPTFDFTAKDVVPSCLHCHQIRDAERKEIRKAGDALPDPVLFPWPSTEVVGLALDPAEKAVVRAVRPDSAASRAGFREGDSIETLEGQPIISIADVQWILHHADAKDELTAEVRRSGGIERLRLSLEDGWRRASDITWRVSTWDLRRMGTGGLVLAELSADERRAAGLAPGVLGLRVDGMGRYAPHDTALRAGFEKGDIIVEFDGRTDDWTRSLLIAHAMQSRASGDRVPVVVLRGGKRVSLGLTMQ